MGYLAVGHGGAALAVVLPGERLPAHFAPGAALVAIGLAVFQANRLRARRRGRPSACPPAAGMASLSRPAVTRRDMPGEETMSTPVFIQIRCRPGTTYRVAEEIVLREMHSELYSTSGDYDLMLKLYIPEGEDVGRFINDRLLDIEGIERSLTTITFKAF